MPARSVARSTLVLLCPALSASALAACGSTVSTSSFRGEQHAVAQVIANLQADATAGEERKICANDLAASVVTRLGGMKACQKAIKTQLADIDSLEVSVQSIEIAAGDKTATGRVKSTYSGKTHPGTIALVKEGRNWKVAG